MYYPILLSMIAAAAAAAPANDPDPTIRITLSNEGQYLPGDRAKVQVITRDDGYLVVFQVNPEGRLRVLFPLDPTDDNYVKGGKRYLLLGRGGREGFTVDAGGTGVVFAAVSLDPWRFTGYVQGDHWDYRALNTITYDDTETDLVNLSQGMASGRFDYDILGYTVASQVAAAEEPVVTSNDVGMIDTCFNCAGSTVGVIYGTGYYTTGYDNSWGLYDPWYYSPYYNYGPYYPAWAYGPTYGWGWGWGCYGYYCNGGNWGYYYPPYPTAVPYTPYQKKGWDRTWNGSPPPYRPRDSYVATNTVSGQLPGVGVQQHASFRDRTWSGATAAGPVAGAATVKPASVPVSKGSTSPTASGGRRRQPAPSMAGNSGANGNTGAPMAVPSRPRVQSSGAPQGLAAPTVSKPISGRQVATPEARPARPAGERPATGAPVAATPSGDRRYQMPVEWTRPSPPPSTPPVSKAASEAPVGTRAVGEGRSAEPVLKRRDPDKASAATPAQRQDNSGQGGRSTDRTPDRGYSAPPPPPPSQPSRGYSGGGSFGGSSGRATPSQPSAPPSAVAGGGRRR